MRIPFETGQLFWLKRDAVPTPKLESFARQAVVMATQRHECKTSIACKPRDMKLNGYFVNSTILVVKKPS